MAIYALFRRVFCFFLFSALFSSLFTPFAYGVEADNKYAGIQENYKVDLGWSMGRAYASIGAEEATESLCCAALAAISAAKGGTGGIVGAAGVSGSLFTKCVVDMNKKAVITKAFFFWYQTASIGDFYLEEIKTLDEDPLTSDIVTFGEEAPEYTEQSIEEIKSQCYIAVSRNEEIKLLPIAHQGAMILRGTTHFTPGMVGELDFLADAYLENKLPPSWLPSWYQALEEPWNGQGYYISTPTYGTLPTWHKMRTGVGIFGIQGARASVLAEEWGTRFKMMVGGWSRAVDHTIAPFIIWRETDSVENFWIGNMPNIPMANMLGFLTAPVVNAIAPSITGAPGINDDGSPLGAIGRWTMTNDFTKEGFGPLGSLTQMDISAMVMGPIASLSGGALPCGSLTGCAGLTPGATGFWSPNEGVITTLNSRLMVYYGGRVRKDTYLKQVFAGEKKQYEKMREKMLEPSDYTATRPGDQLMVGEQRVFSSSQTGQESGARLERAFMTESSPQERIRLLNAEIRAQGGKSPESEAVLRKLVYIEQMKMEAERILVSGVESTQKISLASPEGLATDAQTKARIDTYGEITSKAWRTTMEGIGEGDAGKAYTAMLEADSELSKHINRLQGEIDKIEGDLATKHLTVDARQAELDRIKQKRTELAEAQARRNAVRQLLNGNDGAMNRPGAPADEPATTTSTAKHHLQSYSLEEYYRVMSAYDQQLELDTIKIRSEYEAERIHLQEVLEGKAAVTTQEAGKFQADRGKTWGSATNEEKIAWLREQIPASRQREAEAISKKTSEINTLKDVEQKFFKQQWEGPRLRTSDVRKSIDDISAKTYSSLMEPGELASFVDRIRAGEAQRVIGEMDSRIEATNRRLQTLEETKRLSPQQYESEHPLRTAQLEAYEKIKAFAEGDSEDINKFLQADIDAMGDRLTALEAERLALEQAAANDPQTRQQLNDLINVRKGVVAAQDARVKTIEGYLEASKTKQGFDDLIAGDSALRARYGDDRGEARKRMGNDLKAAKQQLEAEKARLATAQKDLKAFNEDAKLRRTSLEKIGDEEFSLRSRRAQLEESQARIRSLAEQSGGFGSRSIVEVEVRFSSSDLSDFRTRIDSIPDQATKTRLSGMLTDVETKARTGSFDEAGRILRDLKLELQGEVATRLQGNPDRVAIEVDAIESEALTTERILAASRAGQTDDFKSGLDSEISTLRQDIAIMGEESQKIQTLLDMQDLDGKWGGTVPADQNERILIDDAKRQYGTSLDDAKLSMAEQRTFLAEKMGIRQKTIEGLEAAKGRYDLVAESGGKVSAEVKHGFVPLGEDGKPLLTQPRLSSYEEAAKARQDALDKRDIAGAEENTKRMKELLEEQVKSYTEDAEKASAKRDLELRINALEDSIQRLQDGGSPQETRLIQRYQADLADLKSQLASFDEAAVANAKVRDLKLLINGEGGTDSQVRSSLEGQLEEFGKYKTSLDTYKANPGGVSGEGSLAEGGLKTHLQALAEHEQNLKDRGFFSKDSDMPYRNLNRDIQDALTARKLAGGKPFDDMGWYKKWASANIETEAGRVAFQEEMDRVRFQVEQTQNNRMREARSKQETENIEKIRANMEADGVTDHTSGTKRAKATILGLIKGMWLPCVQIGGVIGNMAGYGVHWQMVREGYKPNSFFGEDTYSQYQGTGDSSATPKLPNMIFKQNVICAASKTTSDQTVYDSSAWYPCGESDEGAANKGKKVFVLTEVLGTDLGKEVDGASVNSINWNENYPVLNRINDAIDENETPVVATGSLITQVENNSYLKVGYVCAETDEDSLDTAPQWVPCHTQGYSHTRKAFFDTENLFYGNSGYEITVFGAAKARMVGGILDAENHNYLCTSDVSEEIEGGVSFDWLDADEHPNRAVNMRQEICPGMFTLTNISFKSSYDSSANRYKWEAAGRYDDCWDEDSTGLKCSDQGTCTTLCSDAGGCEGVWQGQGETTLGLSLPGEQIQQPLSFQASDSLESVRRVGVLSMSGDAADTFTPRLVADGKSLSYQDDEGNVYWLEAGEGPVFLDTKHGPVEGYSYTGDEVDLDPSQYAPPGAILETQDGEYAAVLVISEAVDERNDIIDPETVSTVDDPVPTEDPYVATRWLSLGDTDDGIVSHMIVNYTSREGGFKVLKQANFMVKGKIDGDEGWYICESPSIGTKKVFASWHSAYGQSLGTFNGTTLEFEFSDDTIYSTASRMKPPGTTVAFSGGEKAVCTKTTGEWRDFTGKYSSFNQAFDLMNVQTFPRIELDIGEDTVPEICDNDIDDDGDGAVDSWDYDCGGEGLESEVVSDFQYVQIYG